MTCKLTLYSRKDCCLCVEMKRVIQQAAEESPLEIVEIDVDSAPDLREKYGEEIPVLFVNGRKAFKYRVGIKDLRIRLRRG